MDETETITSEAVGGGSPLSPADEGGGSGPVDQTVPAVPTREEIRELVKARLAAGAITVDDVIIDMYASQYAIELYLRDFQAQFAAFRESPIGRMFGKRAEKEARKHASKDG